MGMLKLLSVQHGNHSTFLTHHRKRIAVLFGLLCFCMAGLTGRLVFLMLYRADHYSGNVIKIGRASCRERV